MANRYIPFGYEISNGRIQIIEREAEVVKNVFSLYIQGMSLKLISERLNLQPVTYTSDGRAWDKNLVKRMIDNRKYAGYKEYPEIISQDVYEAAIKCKEQKFIALEESTKSKLDAYRKKSRCAICGSTMLRQHSCSGEKRRNFWKCSDKTCEGSRHVLNEKRYDRAAAAFMNELADKLDMIDARFDKGYEKNAEVISAANDVDELLRTLTAEPEEAAEKIMRLAAVKFTACKCEDNSAITKDIRNHMALYAKKETADGDALNKIIRVIKISPDKLLQIELMNGQIFERQA